MIYKALEVTHHLVIINQFVWKPLWWDQVDVPPESKLLIGLSQVSVVDLIRGELMKFSIFFLNLIAHFLIFCFSEKARALCEAYVKTSFLAPLDMTSPAEKFVDGPQLYRIWEEVSRAAFV